jgi:hypothetical protein
MNTIQIQVFGESDPRTIVISEKLIGLVRERRDYHQEIEDEHGGVEYDDHCFDLNWDIRCEVCNLAGIDSDQWDSEFQEFCWAVEDMIDSQRLQEAAE